MNVEYSGDSAPNYTQTADKTLVLFPVLHRLIRRFGGESKVADCSQPVVLDLGCGRGDLYPLALELGYGYTGIDVSEEMIDLARRDYPEGQFECGDAAPMMPIVFGAYDAVLSVMVDSCLGSRDLLHNLIRMATVNMRPGAVFILATVHPCFDGYMQKGLIGRDYIDTEFCGYFAAATPYSVHRELNGRPFTFNNHHWTLKSYLDAFSSEGLVVTDLDECGSEQVAAGKAVNQSYPIFFVLCGRHAGKTG
ncbi:MAG: class I SAM-dependent methyltransferase [Verrucomicrobia bacterium]|jgi:SAM-dependent methyltransferase|nr:class I SAM-dependent methyltransferase [Verrucomicrobiota bacterium]